MSSVLVAEDDELLRSAVVDALSSEGHKVSPAKNGSDAKALCEIATFDLLILDWNMPGCSGVEVSKSYRSQGKAEPILFLTSRSDIVDKEAAFAGGADDYLTKPFQLRELMIRVRALLKRPVGFVEDKIKIADLIFDPKSGVLSRAADEVKLQPREAELLLFFAKHPGQVVKAEAVRTAVWGADFEGSDVALRACLAKVRKALANFNLEKCIETVHGFGYKYNPPK
ncbi:MAG: response regulator transcription factor [Candidatus Obscuribacterales bacterium]|nr:response regulator transcription factor [Candidatus Obscuribacterales bacterium]